MKHLFQLTRKNNWFTSGRWKFTARIFWNNRVSQKHTTFWVEATDLVGFPSDSDGKSIYLQCRRPGFDPWVRKIPWRRKWQPTPSTVAWKIPWMEETGGLESMQSQRVRHDWATSPLPSPYWFSKHSQPICIPSFCTYRFFPQ